MILTGIRRQVRLGAGVGNGRGTGKAVSPDTRDSAEPGQSLTRAERESLARERLAAELVAVPPIGSPALRTRLRDAQGSAAIASGALVALLRAAVRAHDASLVEELFIALLHRLEDPNTRWAVCVVAQTPAARSMRQSIREDLKQELTLHLWQRLARESDPAWELYFGRALAFAQRRVARSYMRRNGYWPASAQPEALPALLLSRLARYTGDDEAPANDLMAASDDLLSVADLADLRALVLRLPYRERSAVVVRFWLGAREHEIAHALGVTTRTVRNALRRAYTQLRAEYADHAAERRWHGAPVPEEQDSREEHESGGLGAS
jgi:RNA polymerase sigma factor (sigma-70 family)